MSTLITGTDGLIQIGPTNHLTTVGFVNKFEVECKTDINVKGPFFGNATLYKTRKAKTSSGTVEGEIPSGRDPGQTGLISAHEAGTNVRLTLIGGAGTTGYTYTAPSAGLSGVNFGGDAENGFTVKFSFEDMNGYTLVPTT